ncbi:NUDIX domain-containing protein [Paenibacillus qinlingensis]|uniref:Isopentenyldiphosphate isomerase n=1 Tax=Paenibacillus qinlingensis TaxID=1837343 RepID=A0ABU1NQQ7_9BACL|nr:NUDIX domain-containing protein [Paenibacillus qinlingensis]MDR6549804.1 isopentenyldiphosphate isomerase [Paenibacillus qinlingensis]
MKKSEELFDVFDAKKNWLGVAPRSEVHAKGLWHQTFQCWIVSLEEEEPKLLLQLRHPDKDLFPDLLDISSAGHLAAGETIEEGTRELEEELGLSVAFEELIPCGMFAEEDLISDKLMDREFCHVFIYRCDQPLRSYVLQPDEVSGLFAVTVSDFKQLISGDRVQIASSGFKRGENGEYVDVELPVSLKDVVPHPVAYFELLFQKLDEQGWK